MNNNIDLLSDKRVSVTNITKKFSLRGETSPRTVYRIPLELLYYNNKNGRIATLISKWESENGYKITELDNEKYNETIENYIIKSNANAFKKTLDSIKNLNQREAGVVLSNGCIIDGNRRYTCLRRLNGEYATGEYAYFEAVILDSDISTDEKEIKRLELELQHGQDEKVNYNAVESLIDVYKTIKEEKLLTIQEYADNCNKKKSEVEKDLKQAEIIVDFLDYIGAPGKYYMAVDLQLDASVFEIYNIKQKISDEETWEKAKIVLYENMLVKPKGDIKLMMRSIKNIINSDFFEDYYDEHIKIAKKLEDKLKNITDIDSDIIRQEIRDDDDLKSDLLANCERYEYKTKIDLARKEPLEHIEDVVAHLEKVEPEAVKRMVGEDKQDFIEYYNVAKEKIDKIGEVINEAE